LVTFFFALESVLIEVIILLSNDFPVLRCPIHRGNNRILYSSGVNQTEVRSPSSLHRYAESIYHIGYASQDGTYCHMNYECCWNSWVFISIMGQQFPNSALKIW
jgi:hypothetical protein